MVVPLPKLSVGNGNIKVGDIPTFSLPSRITCPGASKWCLQHCYAHRYERRRPHCGRAYSRNLVLSWNQKEFIKVVLRSIPRHLGSFRIHVSGDFYSVDYIRSWIKICRLRPHTLFWVYTRSWMIPELMPALEELRALKNIQLFASVDSTMPDPPAHWRKAYIHTDSRAKGIHCPEQSGSLPSCLHCGYCFRKRTGDVIFQIH